MKKLLFTLLLLSASLIGMAQCAGITMNQTVNGNNATFSASLPLGYTATTYNWTFGDGGSSNQPNPTHTYASSGWYNVCMMVSGSTANNQGFQCYMCDSIYVGGPPMPCAATYTFTQSGLSVSFSGNGTGPGPITNWAWNFGDGNQSNLQNPTHTYASAGTYVACLTVYGVANGTTFTCTYCDTITVSAAGPCAPSFSTQAGAGNTINFTNTSTAPGPINGYTWNFGDGGTSSLQNPSHTYANSGWYNVCLTIWGQGPNGAFQCQSCDSVYVGNVNPGPCNANFTFAYGAGGAVNFTNTSTGTGTLVSTNWNFGDGGTSTLSNPSHTYANSGWYNVCLTVVYNNNGTLSTCYFCDSVYSQAGPAPCNAAFVSTVSGLNAAFTNSATGPGPITSYAWTFGDGGTSSLPNPTHTYANGGSYTVCLTVSGVYNNTPFSCTSCDSIYVTGGGQPCQASFQSTQQGGNTVAFVSTSSAPGPISGYNWTFGDGGTGTGAAPSHTYANPGWYIVCLTIYGQTAAGAFNCTTCDSVYVGNNNPTPCNAAFTYQYTGLGTLAFTNTSTGTGTLQSSTWNFGDGGSSTATNPTHTYASNGWYNVCLTVVYTNNGISTTCYYCDSIYVQAGGGNPCNINANFTGNISGLTANFSNTSNCAGCSSTVYAWSFGDGGTSALTNPSHTYAAGGAYNVCLVATGYTSNKVMCSDTFCYTITVGMAGLNQVQTQSLSLYPNPTSSMVEFSIPGTGTAQLRLSDVSGRVIREEKVNTGSAQRVDVGSLAPGLYFLQVQTENGRFRGSFVKQH